MSVQEVTPSAFADGFRGDLVSPGDAGYDDARQLFNGMIDRQPAMIARCADVADVIGAVEYARANGLELAVRGGGHNGGGLGVVDDGMVIDLAGMAEVEVDAGAGTVRVGGGCTWGDVDRATAEYGRATPSGIISTTVDVVGQNIKLRRLRLTVRVP